MRLHRVAKDKKCNFYPKILLFFVLESRFFIKRAIHPGLPQKNFRPQKNFCFRGRGHFPGLIPDMVISGQCLIAIISTLNFGPWSMKLGRTVQASKKWPTLVTDLVPAGIMEKRLFLCLAKKQKIGWKSVYTDLGKGFFFLCTTLPDLAWFPSRIERFFGPKNSDFGPETSFLL